jgi:integrase
MAEGTGVWIWERKKPTLAYVVQYWGPPDPKTGKKKAQSDRTFRRKKDAEQRKRELIALRDADLHIPRSETWTIREVYGEWFKNEIERRCRIKDRMSTARKLQIKTHFERDLLPEFGPENIDTLTSELVQDWINRKIEAIAPKTGRPYDRGSVKNMVNTLISMVSWAALKGYGVKYNRLKDQRPRVPDDPDEGPVQFFEAEDLAKLLYWVFTSRRPGKGAEHTWRTSRLFVLIMMFAGPRGAEVSALNWEHVRVNQWELDFYWSNSRYEGIKSLKAGTKTARTVPMNPILHAAMKAYWEGLGKPTSGPVLLNARGERFEPTSVWPLWNRIRQAAGIATPDGRVLKNGKPGFSCPYSPHDLRHAAGSFWLAETTPEGVQLVPLEVVSRLLGHRTYTTTWNIYAHQLKHDQRPLLAVDAVSHRFTAMMERLGLDMPASERPALLAPPTLDLTPDSVRVEAIANGHVGKMPVALEDLEDWQREAIRLDGDGVTIRDICTLVNRDVRTVGLFLETAGIRERVAGNLGKCKLTPEEIEEAMAKVKAGRRSSEAIGADYGVSGSLIRRLAVDLGIREKGPDHPDHSPEKRQEVLDLLLAGELSSRDIEQVTGVPRPTFLRWSREAGIKRTTGWRKPISPAKDAKQKRVLELLRAGKLTTLEIAELVSEETGETISEATVKRWGYLAGIHRGRGWKAEAEGRAEAERLLLEGVLPDGKIALIAGVSPSTVGKWRTELGLPKRGRGKRPPNRAASTSASTSAPDGGESMAASGEPAGIPGQSELDGGTS